MFNNNDSNRKINDPPSDKRIIRDIIGRDKIDFSKETEKMIFLKKRRESEEKKPSRKYISEKRGEKTVLKVKRKFGVFNFLKFFRFFSFKKIIFLLIFLAVGGIIYFFLFGFSLGVTVRITPEKKTIPIGTTFIASNDDGDVKLNIVKFHDEKTGEIKASGFKTEEKKASGKIVIYNSFSKSPQILVDRTRFETPTGKIYRISGKVSVPGMKIENGKTIPGSLETTVYADKGGEAHNIEFSDFAIPGFKNDPRYKKIYGRTKTPITGGKTEKVPFASKEDEKSLNSSLEKSLTESVLSKINSQKPAGWILYEGAFQISFSSEKLPTQNNAEEAKLAVKKSADFTGFLLNKEEIIKAINGKYLDKNRREEANIGNFDKLSLKIVKIDLAKGQMIFRIQGDGNFIFLFDEDKLKQDLIKAKSPKTSVFKYYPVVERADIIYNLRWWKFFPKDKSDIKIEIVE